MNVEQAASLAQRLLHTAATLGRAITEVTNGERQEVASIVQEADAAEILQSAGPDVCFALRILAMRLDRAAVVQYDDGHAPEIMGLLTTAVEAWEAGGFKLSEAGNRQWAVVRLSPEWMYTAMALTTDCEKPHLESEQDQ